MLPSYVTLYWDICCKQVFSFVVNKNEFSIIPIFFPAAYFNRAFFLVTAKRHLHISHNAPYLPPKILHKHALFSI